MKKITSFLLTAVFLIFMTLNVQISFAAIDIYDNFSSGSINAGKWGSTGTVTDMLSVVSGSSVGVGQDYVLHASGTGNASYPRQFLIDLQPLAPPYDGAGITFFNFAPPGYTPLQDDPYFPNISLQIGVDFSQEYFLIGVAKMPLGMGIGARHYLNGNTERVFVGSITETSGTLAIGYNAGHLNMMYFDTPDITAVDHVAPTLHHTFNGVTFADNPTFRIGAVAGNGGALENDNDGFFSADVGGLYLHRSTVPEPATMLLLGLGLLGLAGTRKKFKK